MKRFSGMGKIAIILGLCFSMFVMSFNVEASSKDTEVIKTYVSAINLLSTSLARS